MNPPTVQFEQDGELCRWNISHPPGSSTWPGMSLGIILIVFPIPHLGLISFSLATPLFAAEPIEWSEYFLNGLPLFSFWLLTICFIGLGLKIIRTSLLEKKGLLTTRLELTPDRIVSYEPGSVSKSQYALKTANIKLADITHLYVLESMESADSKQKPEESCVVARGPELNQTLLSGLPWSMAQSIAKQLSISIEKTKHQISLIHQKQGEKPDFEPEVKLRFGESGSEIQPADSAFLVRFVGKFKTYTERSTSRLGGFALVGFLGLASIVFLVAMIAHLAYGGENRIFFFVWSFPMLICVGTGLWMFGLGTERTEFTTLPGELGLKHGFLFRRESYQLSVKQIESISVVSAGIRLVPNDDPETPLYMLQIGRRDGEVIQLLHDRTNLRDLQWLAFSLNLDLFGSPQRAFAKENSRSISS